VLIQKYYKTILHRAVHEGYGHIIGFILDNLKGGKYIETLNELLLAQNSDRCTALHLAAGGGNTEF
jgi:hypothetical protein